MQWLKRVVGRERVLFYAGCLANTRQREFTANYKQILSDLGVNFIMLPALKCCGCQIRAAGYEDDFASLRDANLKLLAEHHITKIITPDPHCAYTFEHHYGLEAEHIISTLYQHRRKLATHQHKKVHFHEPCVLRNKLGVSREAKRVINASGFSLASVDQHCCGSCGGDFERNFPKLADAMSDQCLAAAEHDTIITACPYCYERLRRNANVLDLSELFKEV